MFIVINSIDYERSIGNIMNNTMTINLYWIKWTHFLKGTNYKSSNKEKYNE